MSQSSHTEEQPAPDYSNGNRAGKQGNRFLI